METLYKGYRPTIGLEIHAELKTKTKMFCSSKNDPHNGEPNTHVCPVCMGHPGTLPVVNKEAVKFVLMVGRALQGTFPDYTEFDRKNYFYPDIPKGYQISQYLYPLVKGGSLAGVHITRVHLEEDTARSLHEEGTGSLLDYNRAGVPLMELVTEPVIHSALDAGRFARELQLLLRTLGVSDANMEKGEMRVEANISVSKTDTFGTKVEVKNLNSFRSVEAAITYEVQRHIEVLESGGTLVQETRGWDEVRSKTFSQRKKENADDYRYFPDPDIPKVKLSLIDEFLVSRIDEILPELPDFKREKYKNIGLPIEQIELIISSRALTTFFEEFVHLSKDPKTILLGSNYLTSDVNALLNQGRPVGGKAVPNFLALMELLVLQSVTSRSAKDILPEVISDDADPRVILKERNLLQDNDSESVRTVVKSVIHDNPSVVAEFRGGKESVIQFLIGQGMKLTKGTANPSLLKTLFVEEIGKN